MRRVQQLSNDAQKRDDARWLRQFEKIAGFAAVRHTCGRLQLRPQAPPILAPVNQPVAPPARQIGRGQRHVKLEAAASAPRGARCAMPASLLAGYPDLSQLPPDSVTRFCLFARCVTVGRRQQRLCYLTQET